MRRHNPRDSHSLQGRHASPSEAYAGELNSEFTWAWPAVLACFCLAVFAWGFGFYGQSVYLAALRATHGWSSTLISGATTAFYLWGALLLALVPGAIERFGVRAVAMGGALLLGAGTIILSRVTAPWQLYASALVMGVGWACTSTTAIAVILAQRFDRRRGLAISLALNGASIGGLAVAPLLIGVSHALGLARAVSLLVGGALLALLPVLAFCLRPAPRSLHGPGTDPGIRADTLPAFDDRASLLRDLRFWSVALPFAFAMMAQVGFIVHQVAFLLPRLGVGGAGTAVALTAGAATAGRLALATIIDRLDQRRMAAISFASQACGLAMMLLWPASPAALYLGSLVFGLSVGNVVTLPSLIVQREFAGRSFGLVIGLSSMVGQLGLSVGPALLGAVHDATGVYAAAVGLCIGLEVLAAVLILAPPSRQRSKVASLPGDPPGALRL
jgi:MFS family permease